LLSFPLTISSVNLNVLNFLFHEQCSCSFFFLLGLLLCPVYASFNASPYFSVSVCIYLYFYSLPLSVHIFYSLCSYFHLHVPNSDLLLSSFLRCLHILHFIHPSTCSSVLFLSSFTHRFFIHLLVTYLLNRFSLSLLSFTVLVSYILWFYFESFCLYAYFLVPILISHCVYFLLLPTVGTSSQAIPAPDLSEQEDLR
jgi:hypothetical protein